MQKEDFVYLGKIIKRHGYKGDWIAYLELPKLSIFENLNSIFIEIEGSKIPFLVECLKNLPKKNRFIIRFNQVNYLNKDFKNLNLFFPFELLSSKDRQSFAYHEFIGFSIKETQKGNLGKIKELNTNSFQPLIVIEYKEKEVLIPFVDAFIKEINRNENYIMMDLPEGLLEFD